MALRLSGGGYRAMVFHLGCLIRLNELGLLQQLKRISSVSGGSITAGVLGMNWKNLLFQNGVASNLMAQVIESGQAILVCHRLFLRESDREGKRKFRVTSPLERDGRAAGIARTAPRD